MRSAVWGREGGKGGGGCKPSRSDGSATGSEIFFFRAIDPRGLSVAGAALSPSEPHGINKEAEREGGREGEGG